MTPAEMVREFHQAVDAPIRDHYHVEIDMHAHARIDFLEEEVCEYSNAVLDREGIAAIAKELGDIVYVAYGAALEHGFDLDAVVAEVHRSNMTKVLPDGSVLKAPGTGKVLKPPTYEEADVARVLGL